MFRVAVTALIFAIGPVSAMAFECPYREPAMGAQTCPAGSHYDTSYKRCIVG